MTFERLPAPTAPTVATALHRRARGVRLLLSPPAQGKCTPAALLFEATLLEAVGDENSCIDVVLSPR